MRQRRPTPYYRIPSEAPIRDLNTTPLIDVMLVLLVLFIITMPMANHKVAVDLPQAGPAAGVMPVVQRLDIDAAGRLSWNGAPIAPAALPARLEEVRNDPRGELHLHAHAETRYDDFDRLLAVVKGAGIERLGLVDNARFAKSGG